MLPRVFRLGDATLMRLADGQPDRWQQVAPPLLLVLLALSVAAAAAVEGLAIRFATQFPYSDIWEHTAAVRALMADMLHPGDAQTDAGVASARYTPYSIAVAALARALSLSAIDALYAVGVANATLFVLAWGWFSGTFFASRWAMVVAPVVMLTLWGTPWFWANVYRVQELLILAPYPANFALWVTPLLWLTVWRLLSPKVRGGVALGLLLVLAAALSALLLISHVLGAVLALGGAGLMLLLARWEDVRSEGIGPHLGASLKRRAFAGIAMAIGVAAAFIWPYFSLLDILFSPALELGSQAVGRPRLEHLFYQPDGLAKGFWPLVPALVGLIALPFARRHWLILSLGAAGLLAIYLGNIVYRLPLGHRTILLAVVFLHLLSVAILVEAGRRVAADRAAAGLWRLAGLALVVLVVAMASVNGARTLRYLVVNVGPQPTAFFTQYQELADAAGPNALVMGRSMDVFALPAFGAKVSFLIHTNTLDYSHGERRLEWRRLFDPATSDCERAEIVEYRGATHLLASPEDVAPGGVFASFVPTYTTLATDQGTLQLYAIQRPLAPAAERGCP